MTVAILVINVRVVIDEVFVTCVIRRIYIDYIDFPGMGVGEGGKCFKVISFNQNMIRRLGTRLSQCSVFVLH